MALNDPMQSRVQRTIFDTIRKEIVRRGYLPDRFLYPDTLIGDAQFEAEKEVVLLSKGYYIEIFGQSSARNKEDKDCPRVVVFMHKVYEGEIGLPAGKIFTMNEGGNYDSSLLPSLSSNLIFAIHLLSNNTGQDLILNSIISQALGQRKHLKFYDDPDHYFFTFQSSYNDMEDPTENILERVYNYTATDIVLAEDEIIDTDMLPIQNITVDMNISPDSTDQIKVEITP